MSLESFLKREYTRIMEESRESEREMRETVRCSGKAASPRGRAEV
jgi:hypothetical protein